MQSVFQAPAGQRFVINDQGVQHGFDSVARFSDLRVPIVLLALPADVSGTRLRSKHSITSNKILQAVAR
jgi:hypothetical protein